MSGITSFPAFRANVIYEGQYLMGTSIARPLIAKRQMEIAALEGADAVSHGATGKGNDQVRFELGYYAIKPDIKIIAPWREWDLNSRTALMAFAEKHGISGADHPRQTIPAPDGNLLHISYEGASWKIPGHSRPTIFYPDDISQGRSRHPRSYRDRVRRRRPVAVNGKPLSPANLLAELNRLGGKHGIGRIDIVENRFVGMKSRGVYETPGGTILRQAHMAMESITLDREVMNLRDSPDSHAMPS